MPRNANPNLRSDLLVAAVKLLDARGAPDFSMRDLCAEVDYTVTAAYRVFRGRGHLLQAMQLELFKGLAEDLIAEPTGASTTEHITDLGSRFLAWAVAHPARYRFMFHSTEPEALLDEADQAMARAPLHYLEALLRQGAERGELEVEDASSLAVMLFATLHGLVSLYLAQRLDDATVADPVAFYDRWSSTWISALLSEPRSRDQR